MPCSDLVAKAKRTIDTQRGFGTAIGNRTGNGSWNKARKKLHDWRGADQISENVDKG